MTAPLDDEALLTAFYGADDGDAADMGESLMKRLRAVAEAAVRDDWENPESESPWLAMACRNAHERNEERRRANKAEAERDAAVARAEAAEREAARLRAALEWYADERNWMRKNPLRGHPQGKGASQSEFIRMVPAHDHAEPVAYDQGERARAALAGGGKAGGHG